MIISLFLLISTIYIYPKPNTNNMVLYLQRCTLNWFSSEFHKNQLYFKSKENNRIKIKFTKNPLKQRQFPAINSIKQLQHHKGMEKYRKMHSIIHIPLVIAHPSSISKRLGAAYNNPSKKAIWYNDCEIIAMCISLLIMPSDLPKGLLPNRSSVGGSVASAGAAKESMIKFTHSICTVLSGDFSTLIPPRILTTSATILTVIWNCEWRYRHSCPTSQSSTHLEVVVQQGYIGALLDQLRA